MGLLNKKKEYSGRKDVAVTITDEEKREFLRDLNIDKERLKQMRKKIKPLKEEKAKTGSERSFKPNLFTIFAARLFPGLSLSLVENAKKIGLGNALKRSNMPYLLNSYISMIILGTLLSLVVGLIGAVVITFIFPGQNIAISLVRNLFISLALPVLVCGLFYAYPFSQASSIQSKINNELPFVIMHMAAIAGSGVEPTRVFSIIAMSKDYPATSTEIKKLINLINFYGYDLITALKDTAKTTSSEKLKNLLNGISTTIASGGDLRFYLEKNSADTLLDYKLSRERYVEVSGTYADIYTGLLIAAPLIFMLMLSIIGSIGIGEDTETIGLIGLAAIVVLNIGFIIFLQVSQPEM